MKRPVWLVPLGRRIRALRQARKVTQESLAEKAGISVNHLGSIERAAVIPSVDCLWRIADALGVPIEDLFSFDRLPKPVPHGDPVELLSRLLRKRRREEALLVYEMAHLLLTFGK